MTSPTAATLSLLSSTCLLFDRARGCYLRGGDDEAKMHILSETIE